METDTTPKTVEPPSSRSPSTPCSAFFLIKMGDGTRWRVPLEFGIQRHLAKNTERDPDNEWEGAVAKDDDEAMERAIDGCLTYPDEAFADLGWEDVVAHAEKLPDFESDPSLLFQDSVIEIMQQNADVRRDDGKGLPT